MEFILQSQARSEQNQARSDQNQARFEKNLARLEQSHDRAMRRMDQFDKQLKATEKLVRAGMKLVIGYRREQRESDKIFNYKLNALIDAQQRHEEAARKTDAKLDRLIAILLRKNPNGHR